MTFVELIKNCRNCTRCRLRKTATQVVPGNGDIHAKIMFIGEGPGANEDREGIPFCGAAGQFLNKLLGSIDIDRSDVYITNMVKCRPPGNRDPFDDEIVACKSWLDEQIVYIQPKIFVLLGRFAMGKFFPTLKISQAHGKAFKKDRRIYIIMYHPAVALYDASFEKVMLSDMQIFKEILKGDETNVHNLGGPVSIREPQSSLKKKRRGKEQIGMGL